MEVTSDTHTSTLDRVSAETRQHAREARHSRFDSRNSWRNYLDAHAEERTCDAAEDTQSADRSAGTKAPAEKLQEITCDVDIQESHCANCADGAEEGLEKGRTGSVGQDTHSSPHEEQVQESVAGHAGGEAHSVESSTGSESGEEKLQESTGDAVGEADLAADQISGAAAANSTHLGDDGSPRVDKFNV
jgi:hypothetical protein